MSLYNIFTYWEGPEPAYIKLCYETLKKHCGHNFRIYRFSDFQCGIDFQSINHKTDWLKANLVSEHGGFWIDADMIVMQNLGPLVELVKQHGFAGIPGFFGAKPRNKMLKDWVDGMRQVFKSGMGSGFSDLISPLLQHPEFDEFGVFTREMICPIYHTGEEFWRLFESHKPEDFATSNTYVVTLYNSAFSTEFKNLPRSELVKDNGTLLNRLFRKSLDIK
jgi:hypothetical protein